MSDRSSEPARWRSNPVAGASHRALPPGTTPDTSVVAIIALYNGAEFIERSIRTVLDQTRAPDEFIVVDDGSTDEGPQIVRRLAQAHPQIRLIQKENGGQSSARNHGVALSKSRLIALLDQDDGWYPDHLESLVKPFEDPAAHRLGWVYSDLDECDRFARLKNRRILSLMRGRHHPKTQLSECLASDMFILPSASLIAREAFEAVGGFDERLSGYEDDDLFLRMFFSNYDNVFIERPLSYWCIYPASTSFSPRMARSRMIYFDKLCENFGEDGGQSSGLVERHIAPRFFRLIESELLRAQRNGDRAAYEQGLRDLAHVVPRLPRRFRIPARMILRFQQSYRAMDLARRSGAMSLFRLARRLTTGR